MDSVVVVVIIVGLCFKLHHLSAYTLRAPHHRGICLFIFLFLCNLKFSLVSLYTSLKLLCEPPIYALIQSDRLAECAYSITSHRLLVIHNETTLFYFVFKSITFLYLLPFSYS